MKIWFYIGSLLLKAAFASVEIASHSQPRVDPVHDSYVNIDTSSSTQSCSFLCKISRLTKNVLERLRHPPSKYTHNPFHKEIYANVDYVIAGEVFQPSTSTSEIAAVQNIRERIRALGHSHEYSSWLWSCTDIDIIRFLRADISIDGAWTKILKHSRWRITENGADSTVKANSYTNSKLHEEIFWLGLDMDGCPTVVVRALLHDGVHYGEKPQIFSNFLVSLLEEGRRKYGVGKSRMACLVLDRFPVVKGAG